MASIASELIWLKALLADFGVFHPQPISLCCDNQVAMHIASYPVFHERTKHIKVDCHYVREQVQSQMIITQYTRSQDTYSPKPCPSLDFNCCFPSLDQSIFLIQLEGEYWLINLI